MTTILYLHHIGEIGGGERSLLNLLSGLDKSKYVPMVACPAGTLFSEKLTEMNIKVIHMDFPKVRHAVRLLQTAWKLRGIIKDMRVDILHSNAPQTNVPAGIAGMFSGIPVVWHARVLLEPRMVDIDRKLSFLPAAIICNSEAIRRRFAGIRGYEKKTVTIINGVDANVFSTSSISVSEVKKRLGIEPGRPVIGCFDRLDPVKNHEFILRNFAKITSRVDRVLLIIAGKAFDGSESRMAELKNIVRASGMESQVRFEGFIDDIPEMMSICDVIVQASKYEGCSRVVCEAQAMGKPVVASNVGGTPELIKDGATGYLFSLAQPEMFINRVGNLLADEQLRRTIGNNARAHAVANLSLERFCRDTEALYQCVLKDGRN